MKLVSLEIFPKGNNGWKSEKLEFGCHITQLYGPNGCGKTPIVQSIAYCLGYPCVFRKDIYERCNYAVLEVETSKGPLSLKRFFSKDTDIAVKEPTGTEQRFFDEDSYSAYLFEWLGFEPSTLVTVGSKPTSAYLSTLLPIFYLDQDDGYSRVYNSPSNFIKDQLSEMIRMIFRLPVKNSFDKKKARLQAKDVLDYQDRRVEALKKQLDLAKHEAREINKKPEELRGEISGLNGELEQLKTSSVSHDDTLAVFDRIIAGHKSTIRNIDSEIARIQKRRSGIQRIITDIETEIETLNLNEEARRVFLSFSEICGSDNCHLFSQSSDAYSKNLLYLKDQIKDLERNSTLDDAVFEQLKLQRTQVESVIKSIVDERNASIEKSEISALVEVISGLKSQIFELQSQLSELEKIESIEEKLFEVKNERNTAYEKYRAMGTSNSSTPELMKLRSNLGQLLVKWVDKLRTKNISKDISFVDDFKPVLGSENVSQLKGSTRIRVVLAYHAALFELIVKREDRPFSFLILDTPKQHEIHNDDLDEYMIALKSLSENNGIQVVFSTTEYHYEGNELDIDWIPKFPGDEQNMFLKEVKFIDVNNIT